MKAMLVPSALGTDSLQYLTTFIVNDAVAFDAGSLGFYLTPREQIRIRDVFLTHAHMDHMASLPIYLENVSDGSGDCPTIHAPQPILDVIVSDVFNDRVFPDFVRLSLEGPPLVRLKPFVTGHAVQVRDLTVTAAEVDHIVPTIGYLIDDGQSAIAFVTDTAPTKKIWELANQSPRLKAVFLELTFPEEQSWLAQVSKHLTPRLFANECRKVKSGVPIYAIHLKARHREQLLKELAALQLPNVRVLEPGQVVEV